MKFFTEENCPKCREKGTKIDKKVLTYHLDDISKIRDDEYLICKNPECKIIYFALTHSFTCRELNKEVGFKNYSSQQANLCYCYNHKKSDIDENSIKKIQEKMKTIGCKCETRNPIGGCCMASIKKYLKQKSS